MGSRTTQSPVHPASGTESSAAPGHKKSPFRDGRKRSAAPRGVALFPPAHLSLRAAGPSGLELAPCPESVCTPYGRLPGDQRARPSPLLDERARHRSGFDTMIRRPCVTDVRTKRFQSLQPAVTQGFFSGGWRHGPRSASRPTPCADATMLPRRGAACCALLLMRREAGAACCAPTGRRDSGLGSAPGVADEVEQRLPGLRSFE